MAYGDRLPLALVNPIQDFVSTYVSPNFVLSLANSTTVQIVAGVDNAVVAAGISGKWRFISATINRAHPGGVAGVYDVWVVAFDNSFAGVPEVDSTVYDFQLRIVTSGGSPVTGSGATTFGRKVGEVTWDGAAITAIKQTVNSVFTGYGAGIILDFEGPEANIPLNTCVADGRYLDNVTEAAHFAVVGNQWNNFRGLASPPAGKHRVIDLRRINTVGLGNMGTGNASTPTVIGGIARSGINTLGTFMGEEFHTLITAEMPNHAHSGSTGAEAAHTHTGTTSGGSAHSHAATGLTFTGSGGTTSAGSAHAHAATGLTFTGNSVTSSNVSADHTHSGTTNGESVSHTHDAGSLTVGGASPFGNPTGGSGVVWGNSSSPVTGDTGPNSVDHTHSFTTGGISANHTHTVTATGTIGGSTANESAHTHTFTPAGTLGGTTATESAHTHTFTTSAGSSHLHAISAEGGGGSHENVPPVGVVVKVVTLR